MGFIKHSIRPFCRSYDHLIIHLTLDDWSYYMPLPPDVKRVELGDGPVPIVYTIDFKPEQTKVFIGSWVIMPFSTEETILWYQQQMLQKGWLETEKNQKVIKFYHPEKGIRTVISISTQRSYEKVKTMVVCGIGRPWPPEDSEEETDKLEHSLWPVIRSKNGLKIEWPLRVWPDAIPRHPSLEIAKSDDKADCPYWEFIFEADKTIETIIGQFTLALEIEQALAWYHPKMAMAGWQETKKERISSAAMCLHYHHPEKGGTLSLHLQNGASSQQTQLTMQWIRAHSWDKQQEDTGTGDGGHLKPET